MPKGQKQQIDSDKQNSRIKERERRIAEARSLNLLSNTFMTVALEDKLACQHVLRIVTRIEDLVVREVRTQYRISKIASHDAVLDVLAEDGIHVTYVNAEIEDGTEVSQLMKYFKTTDPEDMSQGELSKRIHFLKCEEGGLKVMCEMSEKWIEEGRAEGRAEGREEGRAEGEERKAKEIVFSLADRGMSAENIADIVKMNIAIVKQWLEGATAAR